MSIIDLDKIISMAISPTFVMDVALQNVPGVTLAQIEGHSQEIGLEFADVWDLPGKLEYPTAGEQWEIVSDSVNDTALGTGARVIQVDYLPFTGIRKYKSEFLVMGGTTPVQFVATDAFRFRQGAVVDWGQTARNAENLGNITIRRTSDSEPRGRIIFDQSVVGDPNGLNNSLDGHYTTEDGIVTMPLFVSTNTSKNQDLTVRSALFVDGLEGIITLAENSNYQDTFFQNLADGPFILPPRTDILFIARSLNVNTKANVSFILLLIEQNAVQIAKLFP